MDNTPSRFSQIVAKHRLSFMVAGVILISLIMTAISISLYITSGTASLDLSRPAYVEERDKLSKDKAKTFDNTGPLDKDAAEEFRKIFNSQRAALDGLSNFNDASLSDESLLLHKR